MKRFTLAAKVRRLGGTRALTVTAVVAGLAALSVGTSPASAAPSPWLTYHDAYGPDTSEDFCGVPGLTVRTQGVADGRTRFTAHGSDQLPYYYDRADFTDTWTNLATGQFVTVLGSYQGGAIRVTDNGDGTVTTLIKNTDNGRTYGANGKLISRNTGVFFYELLWTQAGTPTDPSDDFPLEFLGVVKETGLNPDFCATMVPALG